MHKSNNNPRLMHFIRLSDVAVQFRAKSQAALTADLLTMTHRERRKVADLVKKAG